MITVEKQLATVALGLSPKKRARLAELLLESLEGKKEAAVAAAWADEAASRATAFKKGRLKAVSVEKAFGFKA